MYMEIYIQDLFIHGELKYEAFDRLVGMGVMSVDDLQAVIEKEENEGNGNSERRLCKIMSMSPWDLAVFREKMKKYLSEDSKKRVWEGASGVVWGY